MIRNILKNSLVLIIILGVIAPAFNNISFAMETGPEGGAEAAAATKKATAASTAATALKPFVVACVPAIEGSGLGFNRSTPSNVLTGSGSCAQNLVFGVRDAAAAAADAGATTKTFLQRLAAFAAEVSYVLFKKVILDRLVDALVNWINNDGKGAIIENWDQFFQDAANNATGEFTQQIGAGFLCSPFNLQLQLALLPVKKFTDVTCTLNQIIGNINSFTENFQNGSWLAYQETWYPRNNFYGGTIIAGDALARAGAEAKEAAQGESATGQGFLSKYKYTYYIDPNGLYSDKQGHLIFDQEHYQGIRYSYGKTLLTPGSIAAQAIVESTFTIPGNRLIHADDLSAYLTAIFTAATNKIAAFGIDGIRGVLSRNLTNTKIDFKFPCTGLTGDGFKACMASVNAEKKGFQRTQQDVKTTSTGSLAVRTDLTNTLNQSITIQGELVDKLSQLAVCIPNTNNSQELANEQSLLTTLQDKQYDNQTFIDALTAQENKINGINPSTGITSDDWTNLGNSPNTLLINDISDATSALTDAQTEFEKIQTNSNSKLPGIKSKLSGCPKITQPVH